MSSWRMLSGKLMVDSSHRPNFPKARRSGPTSWREETWWRYWRIDHKHNRAEETVGHHWTSTEVIRACFRIACCSEEPLSSVHLKTPTQQFYRQDREESVPWISEKSAIMSGDFYQREREAWAPWKYSFILRVMSALVWTFIVSLRRGSFRVLCSCNLFMGGYRGGSFCECLTLLVWTLHLWS